MQKSRFMLRGSFKSRPTRSLDDGSHFSIVSSKAFSFLPFKTISAPSCANKTAVAAPIPLLAPVQ